eukprot:10648547-Lingulodinium_polyedra.AAC.1
MRGQRWDPGLHALVVETTPANAEGMPTHGDARARDAQAACHLGPARGHRGGLLPTPARADHP